MTEKDVGKSVNSIILDGTFFKIIQTGDKKVVGEWSNCVNKKISGGWHFTSKFAFEKNL